jgi:hypothetical protein
MRASQPRGEQNHGPDERGHFERWNTSGDKIRYGDELAEFFKPKGVIVLFRGGQQLNKRY